MCGARAGPGAVDCGAGIPRAACRYMYMSVAVGVAVLNCLRGEDGAWRCGMWGREFPAPPVAAGCGCIELSVRDVLLLLHQAQTVQYNHSRQRQAARGIGISR